MVKEIVKLFAVFGVMGGIAVGPSLIKKDEVVFEPNLDLPTVGTYENLKEVVRKSNESYRGNYGYISDTVGIFNAMDDMAMAESAVQSESVSKSDYSTTNVQVEGVDEADIIKTDGKYLYHLVNDKLVVSEIYPADSMKVVSEIEYDEGFSPIELYIENDMVVVIGAEYKYSEKYFGEDYTKILIYNSKDKEKISLEKEVLVSGGYNSSRRIDDSLYLVAKKYIRTYNLDDEDENVLP